MQQRSTLRAILQATRALYMTITMVGIAVFLFPFLGWRSFFVERFGGEQNLVDFAIGWVLLGIFVEHLRSSALQRRMSYLARILQRVSPDLRKREAVRILIGALDSEDETVVKTAHEELKRITEAELGKDSAEWKRWLSQQEKGQ